MKIEVVMPKMGESLQEGTILKWLKKPGDAIERDEMILEISTDKVDTEVPSPSSGVLVEILAQENETVEVGKVIAFIETEASAPNQPEVSPSVKQDEIKEVETQKIKEEVSEPVITASSAGLVDVVMPKMGESLQEGTILKWLKKPGDAIERDEMILEISTDKVDTEVPSPTAGILYEILANENETVEVGKVIARISTESGVIPQPSVEKVVTVQQPSVIVDETIPSTTVISKGSEKRFYSPLVRSIAEQENVSLEELDTIQGTGSEGRVNKQDILNYIEKRKLSPKQASVAITTAPEIRPAVKPPAVVAEVQKPAVAIVQQIGPDDEIIPMDRVRQLIAEHMVFSKQTSPHVTSVAEADVTGIVKLREKIKDSFAAKEGFKLTFTPFFAKAAIDGIKAYPMVNVSVDGKNIIRHRRIHLSFATALDDGNLIVPVIKNADALSITGLARAVYDLSTRARSKKLNPDDIQGGTFTITNVGTFGTLFGTPVINQPQVAIMGIGAIKKRPVVKELDGDYVIVARDMAFVSITYDHRVVDGMLAGRCLAEIVKSLEYMNENTISF